MVQKESGSLNAEKEPEWYKILSPIFSEANEHQGDTSVVLVDVVNESSVDSFGEEEYEDSDTEATKTQDTEPGATTKEDSEANVTTRKEKYRTKLHHTRRGWSFAITLGLARWQVG